MNWFFWLVFAVTFLSIGATIFFFSRVWFSGRRLTPQQTTSGVRHVKHVDRFLYSLIPPFLLIVLIEVLISATSDLMPGGKLFWIYIALVITFLITLFCMRRVWTGIMAPKIHRLLAKVVLTTFVGVTVTGFCLIGNLPIW